MLLSPVKRAFRLDLPGVCAKEIIPWASEDELGKEATSERNKVSSQIFEVSRKNETRGELRCKRRSRVGAPQYLLSPL